MKQTFRAGLPRVRQLTADEATVLVWRNDGAARVVTGGRCGHAAIMLRSDKLPELLKHDLAADQAKLRQLLGAHTDASVEAMLLAKDIESREAALRKLGAGGGVMRIKLEKEIGELKDKRRAELDEAKRLNAARNELEATIKLWQNPNIIRWFYLAEADEGPVKHVYISWFPGGDGVGGAKDMTKTMAGESNDFWGDLYSEMGGRAQQNLASGRYAPRAGQVQLGAAYGYKDENIRDDWGQEPDFVISVPALGAANRGWGVHVARMWAWFDAYRGRADAEYRMISTTRSCAGIALQALREGGAEAFLKQPLSRIYVLPNEVAKYAGELRSSILDLNTRTLRFEINVLKPWLKRNGGGKTGPQGHQQTELWTASEWRQNRASSRFGRFSVGEALDKYHAIDPAGSWTSKYRTLGKIFAHTIDEVGDSYFLLDRSDRQEALMVLACQCLNVLRSPASWVYK